MTQVFNPLLGMTTYGKVRRGCGFRKAGATYAVSSTPEELNLDPFLICSPWRPWVDSPTEIGLAAQGMLILERVINGDRTGVWDLWDWIGATDYPYFPDFWTEACFYGTSRLIPVNSPFKLLTNESRHLFVHEKAIIANPEPFVRDRLHIKGCPNPEDQVREFHDNPRLDYGIYPHCTSLLWEAAGEMKKNTYRRHVVDLPRHRPDGTAPTCSYEAAYNPPGVIVEWQSAVLAWMPIEGFEIVEDDAGRTHERALKALEDSGTNIPYSLVEE